MFTTNKNNNKCSNKQQRREGLKSLIVRFSQAIVVAKWWLASPPLFIGYWQQGKPGQDNDSHNVTWRANRWFYFQRLRNSQQIYHNMCHQKNIGSINEIGKGSGWDVEAADSTPGRPLPHLSVSLVKIYCSSPDKSMSAPSHKSKSALQANPRGGSGGEEGG